MTNLQLQNMEDDNVVLRPSVPPPTASSLTVHHFFIQFFRALNHQRSLQEAEQMAERLHVDGTALYELPEKKFIDEFGFEGQTIYQALRRSKWGYDSSLWPKLEVVGATLVFTGSVDTLVEFWWKKDGRTFILPIVCTAITILIGILNLSCRSQAVIDAKWIPEGVKIRQRRW